MLAGPHHTSCFSAFPQLENSCHQCSCPSKRTSGQGAQPLPPWPGMQTQLWAEVDPLCSVVNTPVGCAALQSWQGLAMGVCSARLPPLCTFFLAGTAMDATAAVAA